MRRKRRRKRMRPQHVIFAYLVMIVLAVSSCMKVQEYHEESVHAAAGGSLVYTKNPTSLNVNVQGMCELAQNWESFPEDLVEALSKYPEILPFVLGYPEAKKNGTKNKIDISGEYQKGEIPLFIQWDARWGYQPYGDSMIGVSGCGPTCLSMVVVGLTGDTRYHPAKMAAYSKENGFIVPEVGTDWRLFSTGAERFGLQVQRLFLQEDDIYRQLKAKHPIICSMKPGDFTYTGHFIVLTGVDNEGNVHVNDPNSKRNSGRKWKLGRVLSQMKSAWAYSVAR